MRAVSILGLSLLLVTPCMAQPNPEVEGRQSVAAKAKGKKKLKRGFYATFQNYGGSEVLEACAKGYHLASIWELVDVGTLEYHHGHPDAMTMDDAGSGPVANWWGWVRTGRAASVVNAAGTANCSVWTSEANGEYGTIARLSVSGSIGPWEIQTWDCSASAPVWCVSDKK